MFGSVHSWLRLLRLDDRQVGLPRRARLARLCEVPCGDPSRRQRRVARPGLTDSGPPDASRSLRREVLGASPTPPSRVLGDASGTAATRLGCLGASPNSRGESGTFRRSVPGGTLGWRYARSEESLQPGSDFSGESGGTSARDWLPPFLMTGLAANSGKDGAMNAAEVDRLGSPR